MRLWIILMLLGTFLNHEVTAESVPQSCNRALSQIKENYYLLSEREQFDDYRQRLCEEKFETLEAFSNRGSELGLDFPLAKGMLGLSGSSDSQSSSFKEKYEKFCELNSSSSTAKSKYESNISRISNALANNWLKCHELHLDAYVEKYNYGTFIEAVPQDNYREFSVKVSRKSNRTGDVIINSLNPGRSVNCFWGINKIIEGTTPINSNEFTLSCEKHPSRSIQFSLDTQDGASNIVAIPSQTSKILEMSTKIDALYQQIKELERSKVPSGTVVYFENEDCPRGWSRVSQVSGRYIVGIYENNKNEVGSTIGRRLSANENRPTGSHSHTYPDHLMLHPNGIRSSGASDTGNGITGEWRGGSDIRQADLTRTTNSLGVADTNSPYILMSACRKN